MDKKRYSIHNEYYPLGTIEGNVKDICDNSLIIQYLPIINVNQILKRRLWWVDGYKKTIKMLPKVDGVALVYSDNPYAFELLEYLSKNGKSIYFDVMDNFAIHPSLNQREHEMALIGYKRIMKFADVVSANSEQTCEYIRKQTGRMPILVKNGVFATNSIAQTVHFSEIEVIKREKAKYRKCVGYIGKLGLRLDADLIDKVTNNCRDCLFVFVGPYLKGQMNEKLEHIFLERDNILHVDRIPSAYVYSVLDQFDILTIPHAVGNAENGGDPIKLYQYLTRFKPIITTGILGVDEFKDYIEITDDYKDWIRYIENDNYEEKTVDIKDILWKTRLNPVLKEIDAVTSKHDSWEC